MNKPLIEQHRDKINHMLSQIVEPNLQQDLQALKLLASLQLDEEHKKLSLCFQSSYPNQTLRPMLNQQIQQMLAPQYPDCSIECRWVWQSVHHSVQQGLKPIPEVKNIIAISSGKGGVGKSTVAVNLACALLQEGARVGLLDADIYGPNQPDLLGSHEKPVSPDGKILEPVNCYGLQTMSIGYLIEQSQAAVWRGPMVTSALLQMLNSTHWQALDYLLIDLPPGTGDIQLTMAQRIPVSGAVIVTTPQNVALADVRRGHAMFAKVHVPVLGVIENMSQHICSHCGHHENIFGSGGGQRLAEELTLPFLGSLPLSLEMREAADAGKPLVLTQPESEVAANIHAIAMRMAWHLGEQAKDYSHKFPDIIIKND